MEIVDWNTDLAGLHRVAGAVVASWAVFLPWAVLVVDPLAEDLKKIKWKACCDAIAFQF